MTNTDSLEATVRTVSDDVLRSAVTLALVTVQAAQGTTQLLADATAVQNVVVAEVARRRLTLS